MLVAKESSNKRESVPDGVYLATCVRVLDLGTQYNQFSGKFQRKVFIAWELPDETIEIDGKPMPKMVSKEYTLSLDAKANLRKDLEAWRNKPFSEEERKGFMLDKLLCLNCQVQVTVNENGWERVTAIMALPKGTPARKAINEDILLDLDDDWNKVEAIMHKLPEWIVKKIKDSEEWKRHTGGDSSDGKLPEGFTAEEDEEDLPF